MRTFDHVLSFGQGVKDFQELYVITYTVKALCDYFRTNGSQGFCVDKQCWLSSRNFFRGIYCYANFSIVFGPNFKGRKVLEGTPCPPVEARVLRNKLTVSSHLDGPSKHSGKSQTSSRLDIFFNGEVLSQKLLPHLLSCPVHQLFCPIFLVFHLEISP